MPVDRRSLLASLCAVAGSAWLGACASAPAAGPSAAGRAVVLAPGVYVVPGTGGAPDPSNLGRIGNAGFIVGPDGVIAVDTGTSRLHGEALLATIRSVTDRPVRLALVTHTRPEFLFGAVAFRAQGIPVRMHTRCASLMASRCETCLKNLRQTVGTEPMAGTEMYKADQIFDDTVHTLGLIGRPVRVMHFGHSSGPGDVAVLDETSGVLFAGGLADTRRIPDIQDSQLGNWGLALTQLRKLGARWVVPGHGPAAPADEALAGVERYLASLDQRIRALLEAGTSLLDVGDAAELPGYETWDQYDTIHRRNASVAYLRIERELMFK
jgi:glyoxylase-like metal-dependent hydrolase (beta-lactamase superfamily II)